MKAKQLIATCALALIGASAQAAATGSSDDAYRCRMLGDSRTCATPPTAASELSTRLLPGGHASYLIEQGRPIDQAIAEARASGEEPILQLVGSEAPRQLSGFESHERYLAGSPALERTRATNVAKREQQAVH